MDGAIMQQIQPAVAGCAQARSFSRLLGSRPVAAYSVWPVMAQLKLCPSERNNQHHLSPKAGDWQPTILAKILRGCMGLERTPGILRLALGRVAPSRCSG